MKRFALPAPPNAEGMVHLYDKDYHYLARVRRLKAGSFFDALLPGGGEVRVRVLSTADNILIGECSAGTAKCAVENVAKGAPEPPIALFQALAKGAKMDTIFRQAAEGGVSVVAPFESEYSDVRVSGGKTGGKTERWRRIIRQARQQSGSAAETVARPPCSFPELMDYWESVKKDYRRPVGILLHQEPLATGSFHEYIQESPDFVALAVGPEGGFSPREVSLFQAAGFKPLLMGTTILRVETAAVYGIAALRIILLERESWTLKEYCS
ncbi:MAG: 16S rRNA (uracil(1498)-N(3))-methyltransferase [Treponema sp.]|nr:16S rRNA (uracil(1498)-N(3))-methyltransferase [Treponema sp.]